MLVPSPIQNHSRKMAIWRGLNFFTNAGTYFSGAVPNGARYDPSCLLHIRNCPSLWVVLKGSFDRRPAIASVFWPLFCAIPTRYVPPWNDTQPSASQMPMNSSHRSIGISRGPVSWRTSCPPWKCPNVTDGRAKVPISDPTHAPVLLTWHWVSRSLAFTNLN